jgi:hypothetical protein
MKSNGRVQKITVYDISKINEALASEDLPKLLLNGNAEIALITQRIIKKRLRKDPDGFTSRDLTTLLGVANDKVQNALKKKETKKEANGVVQEEKRVRALEMKEILKEVRAKQRKVQQQGVRELEERRKREQEEKREREQQERWSAPDPYRL